MSSSTESDLRKPSEAQIDVMQRILFEGDLEGDRAAIRYALRAAGFTS